MLLEPSAKAVPQKFTLFVQSEHGNKYKVRADLDEAETQAAFVALHRASPQAPITLAVNLSKDFKKADMVLRTEDRQIPLHRAVLKVFTVE